MFHLQYACHWLSNITVDITVKTYSLRIHFTFIPDDSTENENTSYCFVSGLLSLQLQILSLKDIPISVQIVSVL